MKLKKLLFIPLLAMLLAACNGGGVSDGSSIDRTDPDALLPTPITDGLKFEQENQLEGKKFAGPNENAVDHIGYVSLKSCTDGDTANFAQDDYLDDFGNPVTIKTRFLGVNTPESTAKVEPWGKKASLFTKHKLEEAQAAAEEESTATHKVYNIALINHPTKGGFEIKDSSGGRWLAFIWYRLSSTSDWRLLNLELVEQAYSMNQLFTDDTVCNYRSAFAAAEERNKAAKYRVYGEIDPGYDYEEKTYEYSLWKIIHDFNNIGISDSGSSGVVLCVTALVVGVQGDNMFLRDVLLDAEQVEAGDNNLAGTYAYAGFNTALSSYLQNASIAYEMDGTGVGLIVRFFCRATIYGDNVQLSDLKTSNTGKKPFQALTEKNFAKYADELKWSQVYATNGTVTYADLNKSTNTIRLEPSILTNNNEDEDNGVLYDDLLPYQYQFIDTEVEIRASNPSADKDEDGGTATGGYWYKKGADKDVSYTVYAQINGKDGVKIYTNLRIDQSIEPFIQPATFGTDDAGDLTSDKSPVGTKWHVTGYLARYFNKFQILIPNNDTIHNYIYKIVEQ